MKSYSIIAIIAAIAACGLATNYMIGAPRPMPDISKIIDAKPAASTDGPVKEGLEKATFAEGCFWCTEAVFQQLKGVEKVVSGYTGGMTKNPSYEDICTGLTGHAEALEVTYDPKVISYAELLAVFWQSHDPTTLNRQGHDSGTQYRSAIFYHDAEQKKLAEGDMKKLNDAKAFAYPVVTQIEPAGTFYPAEKYHQNYFNDNSEQGYCQAVIRPKVDKVRAVFKDRLK